MIYLELIEYDLVLKVLYQLGGGVIPPTVITNDEDLGFFS